MDIQSRFTLWKEKAVDDPDLTAELSAVTEEKEIFERFYRVDKARSRQTGGSGLGLAIVRSIVQRNRGAISLSSTLGKGTTFTVSFPAFDTEVDAE